MYMRFGRLQTNYELILCTRWIAIDFRQTALDLRHTYNAQLEEKESARGQTHTKSHTPRLSVSE